MQTVQPNLFIPAMLIGTIDFYHSKHLSVTLILARGHKVSTKQNILTSFSQILRDEILFNVGAIHVKHPDIIFEQDVKQEE